MARMENASIYESYPPLFRPTSGGPIHWHGGDDHNCDGPDRSITLRGPEISGPDALPVIDLENLNEKKLDEACRDWGVFRAVNYGVPVALCGQLHEHVRKIFSLSFETKRALFTSPVTYFWGSPALTPAGETLKREPSEQNIDWVEGFNIPLSHLSQLRTQDPLLENFRFLLEEYGVHQSRLATIIFQAMADNLNLDPMQSKDYLSLSTGLIRVYRYPHCYSDPNQVWGMNPHTDSSVLSILSHDNIGGLQVYKEDIWLDIKPMSEEFVVNLGDMMQAISNDEYRSVRHGVKVNRWKDRISIGYFVFPAEEGVIQSSVYRPFTYADFRAQVQEDLQTIGFKVGLGRFKLPKAS